VTPNLTEPPPGATPAAFRGLGAGDILPAGRELAALPSAPPPDGGPWRWEDPRGRGPALVPGIPACVFDISPPGALYRACGRAGARYPCGWRCREHAPATAGD